VTVRPTHRIVIDDHAVDATSELKLDPVWLIPRYLHCGQITITSDRVALPGPDAAVHFPQLVADLGLGTAGDLPPHARAGRAEAEAGHADVPILGGVPVDRVLALPAALVLGLRHGENQSHWLPYACQGIALKIEICL
jgi:hypothetical protein